MSISSSLNKWHNQSWRSFYIYFNAWYINIYCILPICVFLLQTCVILNSACVVFFLLKRQIIKREQHSEAEHLHKHNGKQVQHIRVGGWLHLHSHNKCVLIKRIHFIVFKMVHKMIFLSCERHLHPGKIVWNRLKILSRPRSLLLKYWYVPYYAHLHTLPELRTFLNS